MSAFLRWSGHPVRLAECLQMTHRGAAIASVAPASSGSVQQEIEAPREDVKGEDYEDFARSAAANPIGRNVKISRTTAISPALLSQPKLITNASKNHQRA